MVICAPALPGPLQAQIVTDGTVGPARALTGPQFQIPDTLGTIRGQNLFHSFQTFNLSSAESATFTSLNPIANVFSRVTGGSPSSINGLLKCDIPGANFYFINPAGVLFGPNAVVDVQGAFAVTTADYVRFADGGRFDARTPANDVLTVANPVAFGFLTPPAGQSPAGVTFNNCTVQVPDGQTLTVAAGAVEAQNGAAVKAPGGTLQVAAVRSAGELPVAGLDNGSFSALEDITLSGSSLFSTSRSGGGGRFLLRAQDLSLSDNAGIANNSLDIGAGGASEIDLRGTLTLETGGHIVTLSTGQASGGSLSISAQAVNADTGGGIGTDGYGSGQAASITISAPSVSLQNEALFSSNAHESGAGGEITITADSLGVFSDSMIASHALDTGPAGNINIQARNLTLNQGAIRADTSGAGAGGQVRIAAENLSLSGSGASINASTSSSGSAGNILIVTGDLTLDDHARILAATLDPVGGEGGSIEVAAHNVTLQDGSFIASATVGVGNAGPIQLTASGRCLVDSSSVFADTMGQGGAAGDIAVKAGELELRGTGSISSSTDGNGAGGSVNITADNMSLTDAGHVLAVTTSSGKGGNLGVNVGTLRLSQNSFITAESEGTGSAGTVNVQADQVQIEGSQPGSAGIFSSASGSGRAGSIDVQAGQVSLANGEISCSANEGDAGSVTLVSGDSITLNNSFLEVYSASGNAGTATLNAGGSTTLQNSQVGAFAGLNGGNITINSQILGLVDSSLDAHADKGNGGHISITTDFFYKLGNWSINYNSYNPSAEPGTLAIQSGVDFASSLSALPIAPLQEASKIREGCARKNPRANSLIVRGKGGVAARPDTFLPTYDLRLEPANQL